MRSIVTIFLTVVSFYSFSQRHFVRGVVKDHDTKEEMIGTHVRNLSSDKLVISDAYGKFQIPVQVGDTLLFTSVGHQRLGWIAKDEWFSQERVEFLLPVDTIYLQEVEIGQLPPEEVFKELILETQPEDTSFWYHGMPKPVIEEATVMEKKQYLNPLYMATHPLSAVYHSFSKREKEKRKMQKIERQLHVKKKVELKFNRKWVGEMTRLEGDRLTDFIAYCNFSTDYLNKTPKYVIYEDMMALLDKFLVQEKNG